MIPKDEILKYDYCKEKYKKRESIFCRSSYVTKSSGFDQTPRKLPALLSLNKHCFPIVRFMS